MARRLIRGRLASLTFATFPAAGSLRADTNRLAEAVRTAGEFYRQGLYREAEKAAAEALSILENSHDSQPVLLIAPFLQHCPEGRPVAWAAVVVSA